jgi:acyl carrier protein
MHASRTAIFDSIVSILRGMSAHQDEPITDATELYYDLGLSGVDLSDVIIEIRRHFGTDFSELELPHYAPGEGGHGFDLNLVRQFREWRGEHTYQSLTVSSLVEAVQAGRWKGS